MARRRIVQPNPASRPVEDATTTPVRPRERDEMVRQPDRQLEADVLELSSRLAAGTYELLVLVGELDRRGTWTAWGALSCAAWLANACDIDISTARTQVRVARAMLIYPDLDAAMAAGDISYAKARVLTAYLTPFNVEDLLEIASSTPAARLGVAIAAWSQRNDDEEVIRDRQRHARSVSWRTEPDGMVVLTARLQPEAASTVCAAIDARVTCGHAPAGATLGQQRADALEAMATGGGGAVLTEVVVHVTEEGNRLTDGTPLSDHAVARLIPDSLISLLIHDTKRYPIDASPRRRNPTRRQRRVLDEREPECAHQGCGATCFLQYDHIEPYAAGGPTVLDNLQRLCGPHNRARVDASKSAGTRT